jgi:hypothetical protein
MARKLWERPPQSARETRSAPSDFCNIPTEDPRAALQFCQSLARMIAGSNPAINTRQNQIAGIKAAPSIPEHQPERSVVIPVFNNDH